MTLEQRIEEWAEKLALEVGVWPRSKGAIRAAARTLAAAVREEAIEQAVALAAGFMSESNHALFADALAALKERKI